MKRKGLALLIGAAMMAASLVGCGGKDTGADNSTKADNTAKADNAENVVQESVADSGEVIELEFWGWWSSEARKPHMEEMVKGFNESQSKYHVT